MLERVRPKFTGLKTEDLSKDQSSQEFAFPKTVPSPSDTAKIHDFLSRIIAISYLSSSQHSVTSQIWHPPSQTKIKLLFIPAILKLIAWGLVLPFECLDLDVRADRLPRFEPAGLGKGRDAESALSVELFNNWWAVQAFRQLPGSGSDSTLSTHLLRPHSVEEAVDEFFHQGGARQTCRRLHGNRLRLTWVATSVITSHSSSLTCRALWVFFVINRA